MNKNGKIINYIGSSGMIIDEDGEKYIVSSNNIMYSNPKNGDLVSFKSERFKTVEIDEKIAILVTKIDK